MKPPWNEQKTTCTTRFYKPMTAARSLVPIRASAQRLEIFPGQNVAGVKLQRRPKWKNGLLIVTEAANRRAEVGLGTRIVGLELDRGCQFLIALEKFPAVPVRFQIEVSVEIIWPAEAAALKCAMASEILFAASSAPPSAFSTVASPGRSARAA